MNGDGDMGSTCGDLPSRKGKVVGVAWWKLACSESLRVWNGRENCRGSAFGRSRSEEKETECLGFLIFSHIGGVVVLASKSLRVGEKSHLYLHGGC